jgi:hypothetical protein
MMDHHPLAVKGAAPAVEARLVLPQIIVGDDVLALLHHFSS